MLTKRIVPALLSVFVWCLTCAAQTAVVDVKDESTVKCHVRMSGTIELTESEGGEVLQGIRTSVNRTSFASTLSATNLSNAPIIAMVTYTVIGNSMGPLLGENHLLDAFFDHDKEIAPGQTWTKKRDDNGVSTGPVPKEAVKIAPAASSQVIFVQFADGNTCGDPNDGRVTSLMETRTHLLQALKKVDYAAKIDEGRFLKALADKSMDGNENADGILNYIRDMQKEKGSTAAIEYIRSMLDVAASR
jgi:hypothetical protein